MGWSAAIALVLLVVPAAAQIPEASEVDSVDVGPSTMKSVPTAVVLEWFLPTLGYAYADRWSRGVPFALARFIGAIAVVNPPFGATSCDAGCIAGAAIGLTATVWAMIDVARVVERRNETVGRGPAAATLLPSYDGSGPGLVVRVPVGW